MRIDGIALERTEFDVTAYDEAGTPLWRRSGRQFIHRDWRLFLADTETFETAAFTAAELCHFLGREPVCAFFTWPASASTRLGGRSNFTISSSWSRSWRFMT